MAFPQFRPASLPCTAGFLPVARWVLHARPSPCNTAAGLAQLSAALAGCCPVEFCAASVEFCHVARRLAARGVAGQVHPLHLHALRRGVAGVFFSICRPPRSAAAPSSPPATSAHVLPVGEALATIGAARLVFSCAFLSFLVIASSPAPSPPASSPPRHHLSASLPVAAPRPALRAPAGQVATMPAKFTRPPSLPATPPALSSLATITPPI